MEFAFFTMNFSANNYKVLNHFMGLVVYDSDMSLKEWALEKTWFIIETKIFEQNTIDKNIILNVIHDTIIIECNINLTDLQVLEIL